MIFNLINKVPLYLSQSFFRAIWLWQGTPWQERWKLPSLQPVTIAERPGLPGEAQGQPIGLHAA